jgi:hypothetical protein
MEAQKMDNTVFLNKNSSKLVIVLTFFSVLLLSTLQGCALLSTHSSKEDYDPIAEAALRQSGPSPLYFNPQNSLLTQHTSQHRAQQDYEIQLGLETGEVVLGMSMNDVISIWGRPRTIETAGDSIQGNQKWIYLDGLSNHLSLESSRVVYFESGHVIGWKTDR